MKIIYNKNSQSDRKYEVYYDNKLVAKFRTMRAAKAYAENTWWKKP